MILKTTYDCIIIGAGISGLSLGRRLVENGLHVLILEKSKGVGGRIATRRDGPATYDHGAQFYKIPNQFQWELDKHWTQSGLAQVWFKDEISVFKTSQRGMTQLAKNLAQNKSILFGEKVLAIQQKSSPPPCPSGLEVICESGQKYTAETIFISAPLPQATELLKASSIDYPNELDQIEYASALVGLFELSSGCDVISEFTYSQNVGDEIFSISNQLSKKVSESLAFTVVMQPEWSRKHFSEDDSLIISRIAEAFSAHFKKKGAAFSVQKQQLKKWRFSHPTSTHSAPYVTVGENKNIFLLGDAFGGPSVFGASKSADSIPLPKKL
jgi:renalase